MAGENCNLNEDEAEIFKPSSPSSSKTPPTSSSPPQSLFLKPSAPEFSAPERPQVVEKPANEVVEAAVKTADQEDVSSSRQKPGEDSQQPIEPVRFSNRCSCCRKKVGLTGFRCRCGELFCGRHRYSDAHDCTFDYKTAGREQISKANPLIRAAKIIKI